MAEVAPAAPVTPDAAPPPTAIDAPGALAEGRPGRAALLAEIETLAPEPAAVPMPTTDPDAEPTVPEGTPAPDPDADPDDEDTDQEDVEEAAAPTPGVVKPDPEQEKRLAAVQKAEKRAKEAVARDREAFEVERRSWAPKLEAFEAERAQFETLRGRAKYDPVAVLLHLGLTVDDLEPAAKSIYAHSKAAAADPKLKDAAQRAMREREHADVLTQTRRELAEVKQQMQERDQREVTQRNVTVYLEHVVKAAGDETPLVQRMLTKNVVATRQRLHQVAVSLADQTGEAPDPIDVVRALERARRDELDELGIDIDSAIKAPPKKTNPVAGEKKAAAKTLGNDLGTPISPRSAQANRTEVLADVRRALENGRLE